MSEPDNHMHKMKIISKLILIVILVTFFVGCKTEAETIFESSEKLTLEIHDTKAGIIKKDISKDSALYDWLHKWLKENKAGWFPEFVCVWHPPSFMISGHNFSVDFGAKTAIVSFTTPDKKNHHYSKKIRPDVYEFIQKEIALHEWLERTHLTENSDRYIPLITKKDH